MTTSLKPAPAHELPMLPGQNHAWLLMAATLALFSTETLFNIPFWLMAMLGLYQFCRAPRAVLGRAEIRLAGALFLCLWLPQLAALPDAANRARSMETVIAYPHFFFAAVCILGALRDPEVLRRMQLALFAIVTVWVLDALVQYTFGVNLLGYPYRPGQLTGMFDPKIRLGHLLAVLAPIYFETVRRYAPGRPWLWALPLLLCAVIFLSGKRVAWVMAAIAILGYALHLHRARALSLRLIAGAVLLGALGGAILLATNESLARRSTAMLGIFSGDLKTMDRATSHRLPLWTTAINIAQAHWINGVGPRGYRYVFRDFAGADNFFLQDGRDGQTHPHQLVLEVAAETGMIGLAGLLGFWWLLIASSWRRLRQFPAGGPWLVCGLVAWLPLNAHLAFYGSYWSSVSWWVLLPLLALGDGPPRARPCPAS
jgi:O-antigen ligase